VRVPARNLPKSTPRAQPRRPANPARGEGARREVARDAATRAAATRATSHVGRLGALLVVGTIAALAFAVVFHVILAQRQMQFDRLTVEITEAQRAYDENRLREAMLSSPERIISEGQRLGLVAPAEPATYLTVPGARQPKVASDEPATTIDQYRKVKRELGAEQP